MAISHRVQQSIDALVARDDVWIRRDVVEGYLATGAWTEDSFVDDLERHARERPHALAIMDEDGRRTTYGEYERRSRELALGLLDLGLVPGDRLAMQLPNSSEFCLTMMACARARIIPVFLHMPYTEHDLSYILELTGTRALAIMRQYRGRDYLHMAQELRRRFPHVQHVVSVGGGADAVDFEELIARPKQTPASRLEELRPTGVDPFFIMFTSGTTGRPKAELHLHANNLAWIRSFSSVHHFPADAHWIIVTPIAHLTGFGLGVLSALKRGAPFTLLTAWDVHRCIELVERDQPTFLLGAPPMLIDIARYPDLEARNVRSLKTICYAGAPCPAEILNTLNRRLGAEIIAFYGYTEGGVTHCTQPGDPLEITSTSLGKLAPGVEQRFVDEDGNIVEPPCEAEIWCRGPSFIPGYFGQPETTRRLFTPDGWYKSGDIIRMDANGYGYFVARKDDLINRGGYKIDPREIEEVLYRHPRVAQAAVVAMPDERLGQRACAFIVPKETGDVLTLADITGFLEAQGVSRVKWPEAVEMVDAFPMTSTGKFMRYALRERARELKPQR